MEYRQNHHVDARHVLCVDREALEFWLVRQVNDFGSETPAVPVEVRKPDVTRHRLRDEVLGFRLVAEREADSSQMHDAMESGRQLLAPSVARDILGPERREVLVECRRGSVPGSVRARTDVRRDDGGVTRE